jgi:hypothetical protein
MPAMERKRSMPAMASALSADFAGVFDGIRGLKRLFYAAKQEREKPTFRWVLKRLEDSR